VWQRLFQSCGALSTSGQSALKLKVKTLPIHFRYVRVTFYGDLSTEIDHQSVRSQEKDQRSTPFFPFPFISSAHGSMNSFMRFINGISAFRSLRFAAA